MVAGMTDLGAVGPFFPYMRPDVEAVGGASLIPLHCQLPHMCKRAQPRILPEHAHARSAML